MKYKNSKKGLRKIKQEILWHLPAYPAHWILYYRAHRKTPDFSKPETYDEKIQWLMIHLYHEEYGKYADKYQVRHYVEDCGLSDLLIPLYGIYENVEGILYESLPDKFILLANHGSGSEFYWICHDKANLMYVEMKRKLNKALRKVWGKEACEYQYKGIKPLLICEKLLENDGKSSQLTDYKVVCCNGKPEFILVCTERDQGRDYYSTDWKYLDFVKEEFRSGMLHPRPYKLEEMLKAAERLSAPFPLSRIDFYLINEKIYFGEITLTPSGGCHNYLNEKGQKMIGQAIRLPIER